MKYNLIQNLLKILPLYLFPIIRKSKINLLFFIIFCLSCLVSLNGCTGWGNPVGPPPPDYPYYITKEPLLVKKILVPSGSKLIYQKSFFKSGWQDFILDEEKLEIIKLPEGKTINWGGVPITMIVKFANPEVSGFSVYADFDKLKDCKTTRFSKMWKDCNDDLGVIVMNIEDWSFNYKNITDVNNCGVLYQRYYKENESMQKYLNDLYKELVTLSVK